MNKPYLSIIIPCLNEEASIATCVKKAISIISQLGFNGECIVVDNGSIDKTAEIAAKHGAKVVYESIKGYGAAYLKGFAEAKGDIIIMGDGDNSYDFLEIPKLVEACLKGADLVIGSRFKGTLHKGSMPFSHRFIGNPILTGILNFLFHSRLSDSHSGFRAIKREAIRRLNLRTIGMEFASEMIVCALREKLVIDEVPINYYKRQGESKLRSFSDAWRHIRFMFLYSPEWLFFVPGLILFFGGLTVVITSAAGLSVVMGHYFSIKVMIFFLFVCIVGFQIVTLGLFAKAYSFREGFDREDFFQKPFFKKLNLEKGLFCGGLFCAIGLLVILPIAAKWFQPNYLAPYSDIKLSLFALLFLVIGLQTIFSSFLLSLLRIPSRRNERP